MIIIYNIIFMLLGIFVILTYKELIKLRNKLNEIQLAVSKDYQPTKLEQYKLLKNHLYKFFDIDQEEDKIYAVTIDEVIVDHKTNDNYKVHTTVAVNISDNEIQHNLNIHKTVCLSTYTDSDRVKCILILKAIYGYLAKSIDTVEHFYIKSNYSDREKGIWFDGHWEKQYTTYYTFNVMTVPVTAILDYIDTDYGKETIIKY